MKETRTFALPTKDLTIAKLRELIAAVAAAGVPANHPVEVTHCGGLFSAPETLRIVVVEAGQVPKLDTAESSGRPCSCGATTLGLVHGAELPCYCTAVEVVEVTNLNHLERIVAG